MLRVCGGREIVTYLGAQCARALRNEYHCAKKNVDGDAHPGTKRTHTHTHYWRVRVIGGAPDGDGDTIDSV